MPTTVGALCGASAFSSASFVVRRIVLPTLRPRCSASVVLMATSPVVVGRRPLLRVVNWLRVGMSWALTEMLVALRSCLGRSRLRTSQWRPRTEVTPSRAETRLRRASSSWPPEVWRFAGLWTTTLASPTDRRAPVCIWVRAESEMMKAKAMRAALMATATRAAAVRRRSRRDGISGPPFQWRRGCRSRTSGLRWEARHGVHCRPRRDQEWGRRGWCSPRRCGGALVRSPG